MNVATILAVALTFSGCGTAVGVHEKLPPASYAADSIRRGPIEVLRAGETPSRPIIRIANVAAHGNGYADQNLLEETLVKEAEKLNADCLFILGKEVTKDETVGSYSGGIFLASQIQRPHLYGVACKYSKVRVGIRWDKDGYIDYVFQNSAAERIGITEGQKILAVNGQPFTPGSYLLEKEVSTKAPGDKVQIELLSKSGEKLRKEFVLDPFN